jgi:hypothetical protein
MGRHLATTMINRLMLDAGKVILVVLLFLMTTDSVFAGSLPEPTRTPGPCVGDCGRDGAVTVDELVVGVAIALGVGDFEDCPEFDIDGNSLVTVDELIAAVGAALQGCLPSPEITETPTPTTTSSTPTTAPTPTNTPTQSPIGESSTVHRAAGTIQSTTTALLVVPDLVSAMVAYFPGAISGVGAQLISIPFSCPGGGGGEVSCDQDVIPFPLPPTLGPPEYSVTLDGCKITPAEGVTTTFAGSVMASGAEGEFCGTLPTTIGLNVPSLTVTSEGPTGSTTTTLTGVSGVVDFTGDHPDCQFDAVNLQITGTFAIEAKDTQGMTLSSTEATFQDGSNILIFVDEYGEGCVPVVYTMFVDGSILFSAEGVSFLAGFNGYTLLNDATSGTNFVEVFGLVDSSCFGGAVDFLTVEVIERERIAACAIAGLVETGTEEVLGLVRFAAAGAVEIDLDGDGTSEDTVEHCSDPILYQCMVP